LKHDSAPLILIVHVGGHSTVKLQVFETSFQRFRDSLILVVERLHLLIVFESQTLDTIVQLALTLQNGGVALNRIPLHFYEFLALKSKHELFTVLFNQFSERLHIIDNEG
jgi:hypothetical protein